MEKLDKKDEEKYKKTIEDIYRNNPALNKYFKHS